MDKRGFEERTILWAFYSFLAIILLIVFLAYIKEAVTGIGLQKDFLARDLALTLDAVYASPNDLDILYLLEDKVVEIKNNVVMVSTGIGLASEYEFASDSISNLDGVYRDKIIIKKEDGKVSVVEFKIGE